MNDSRVEAGWTGMKHNSCVDFRLVSAFYVECPQKNMCMNCHVWTKSKFYGMSIGVELIGDGKLRSIFIIAMTSSHLFSTMRWDATFQFPLLYFRFFLTGVLTLLNHDEEYVFTFPNAYCRYIESYSFEGKLVEFS